MSRVPVQPQASCRAVEAAKTAAESTSADLSLYNRESRRLNYKNKGQFRQDELKKKREEQQVEIRKQKREESIAKRRNLQVPSGNGGDSDEDEAVATQLDSQVSSLAVAVPPRRC